MKQSKHFHYWDQNRGGISQIEIAQNYNVSRQAVNKSLQTQKNKVLSHLLSLANTIQAFVEWQNEELGVLVGIVPQLENQICLIIIDSTNKTRVYYESVEKTSQFESLLDLINEIFGISTDSIETLREIIDLLVKKIGE
jgi:transcriptional regulator with XRE-family HTH domain